MCKNDLIDDEIQPPGEKARRALIQKISKQKVTAIVSFYDYSNIFCIAY